MVEKKIALVAAIVALVVLGSPIAATAASNTDVKQFPGISIHTDDHPEDHDDDDDDEDDDDEDDRSIPPVFVVPGAKAPHPHARKRPAAKAPTTSVSGATSPVTTNSVEASIPGETGTTSLEVGDFVIVGAEESVSSKNLDTVNPTQSKPVAIEQVRVTMKTPADQFMDTASIGLGFLAVSALGLASTAAVRSIRLRRSGNSDYFYDEK